MLAKDKNPGYIISLLFCYLTPVFTNVAIVMINQFKDRDRDLCPHI